MSKVSNAFGHMREVVGGWAAKHHHAELLELIRVWLGDTRPDEATTTQAISFALMARKGEEPSLAERYASERHRHSRLERAVLDGWRAGRFAVLEVLQVRMEKGLSVRDILTDEVLFVPEKSATRFLERGTWLLAALVRTDEGWVLEGAVRPVPRHARIYVVQGLLAGGALEAVQAWHAAIRPPRFENTDGHVVAPVELTIDLDWSALVERAARWPDALAEDDAVSIVSEAPDPELGHRVIRAVFYPSGDAVLLSVNSREREAMVLERLPDVAVRERRELDVPPSHPEGVVLRVDHTLVEAEDPLAALNAGRIDRWPHEPIRALDGLTPLEAIAAGRVPEVRALVPDDADDGLWTELGLVS